jgi:hypothetical protein
MVCTVHWTVDESMNDTRWQPPGLLSGLPTAEATAKLEHRRTRRGETFAQSAGFKVLRLHAPKARIKDQG